MISPMWQVKLITIGEVNRNAAVAAKLLQSCPTLRDPIDGNPPASPDPGILQARTLEWVAISFSNAWKWKVKVKSLSRVRLFSTHGLQPTRLLHSWDLPGKSTGLAFHCLLLNRNDDSLNLLMTNSLIYPSYMNTKSLMLFRIILVARSCDISDFKEEKEEIYLIWHIFHWVLRYRNDYK